MPRTAKTPQIPAIGPLDRSAGALGRQLAQKLRDAVKGGGLQPGSPCRRRARWPNPWASPAARWSRCTSS